MTEDDTSQLIERIYAGERPTDELWQIRKATVINRKDQCVAESLSDLWSLAFRFDDLFPKLEAAKAIVEIAWAADISYPVLTNDGFIYDCLSLDERKQLFDHIADLLGEERASVAAAALADFSDDLMGKGPV